MLSMRESMAQERRLEVHKKHDNKFQFFVDDKGETPPITSSSSTRAGVHEDVELERRSWSKSERKRLLSGIHIEAQRALVFELVSRNDEHRIWEIDKMNSETLENIEVDKLDWNRISSLHVKSRTPMQCIIQWTTQEHPKINKRPWSKAESKLLMELVDIHGYQGQWEKIAVELDTNRTASQCFSHYQSEHNNINSKRKWTKEDDEALTQAVEILGERNWQQVAYIIGDRTGNQCLQRWSKSISPAIRRQRWTKEEDDALKGAVEAYGVGNWNKVQRYVPGRTDMQCRERYMNVLDPRLNTSVFTSEETAKLVELIEKHGRRWSYLTQYFPGRTDNHLFRAWKAVDKEKEKLNKAKNGMLAAEPDTESTINEQEDDDEEEQRPVTAPSSPLSS
ncbi:Homeodomain-like protein [Circinella umbellata]|nr:Homeodomain-like protein [Circinella umbellata]